MQNNEFYNVFPLLFLTKLTETELLPHLCLATPLSSPPDLPINEHDLLIWK